MTSADNDIVVQGEMMPDIPVLSTWFWQLMAMGVELIEDEPFEHLVFYILFCCFVKMA